MYLFYRINKIISLFLFCSGQRITESQQTLYSTCQKCRLQIDHPDCHYVQCVEKLLPPVYCSEVSFLKFYIKTFLFCISLQMCSVVKWYIQSCISMMNIYFFMFLFVIVSVWTNNYNRAKIISMRYQTVQMQV